MLPGKALVQLSVFSEVVHKCDTILHEENVPRKVNIMETLTSERKTNCENILNYLVGITVMQVSNFLCIFVFSLFISM